jgi:hypothetical protein
METASPPPPPASSSPPVTPIVFGVINTLFGFFGLVGALFALRVYFMPLETQTGPVPELMRADSFFALSMRILAIPAVLYNLAVFLSGIGLFRSREWARRTAIFASLYAIPAGIFGGYLSVWHIVPFRTEYTLRLAPQMPESAQFAPMMRAMMQASGMMGAFVAVLIPILVIIFLTRPKVRVHCVAASSKAQNLIA